MNSRRQIPQSLTWTVPVKASTSLDSTRFKVHRLCCLVLSEHIPTYMSSHSIAGSRGKLHLTRHHPTDALITSRPGHTPRLKHHVYALPQRVATYQFNFHVLKCSSWKGTWSISSLRSARISTVSLRCHILTVCQVGPKAKNIDNQSRTSRVQPRPQYPRSG